MDGLSGIAALSGRLLALPALIVSAVLAIAAGSPLHAQFVTSTEKNDLLLLRNGDWITGDFRGMERGIVTFKTDAAATIHVKWPRVLTATTDKIFDIHLSDQSRCIGSLLASDSLGRVVIRAERDTFEVPMQSVVDMVRIKDNFWKRLDGSIDFGLNYTQQNAKTDIYLDFVLTYLVARNRFNLNLTSSFSRQDSVSNITRSSADLTYLRELKGLWFIGFIGSLAENSQLSLELRGSLGGGPGRYLILKSRLQLATWLVISGNRERFTGEDSRNTLPLGLATDFQFFDWSGKYTDLSARLTIQPILNDAGRWQIRFEADITQEILDLLYLRIGLLELYDSKPPSATANKNDFSITTSLGWTF